MRLALQCEAKALHARRGQADNDADLRIHSSVQGLAERTQGWTDHDTPGRGDVTELFDHYRGGALGSVG